MITLKLFESNRWDSFQEIYVLKCINKLYFGQNNKKWVNLVIQIINLFTFQIWEILRSKVIVKLKCF
jgi:hypothetical protein